MFAVPLRSEYPLLGRHLRAALSSPEPSIALGTYGSVDVVVYPRRPGARQSILACLRSGGSQAYVDSAHYRSWRAFAAAVVFTAKHLGQPA